MHRDNIEWQLRESGGASESELYVLHLLPARFDFSDLEHALNELETNWVSHENVELAVARVRWISRCNYAISFPEHSRLSERVLWPQGPTESHGMEDARFVQFNDTDVTPTYLGTYTAFDGAHVVPQLIETDDFHTFQIRQLSGSAAKNKGLAIFPRKIGGQYVALSRWDREANDLVTSDNARHWDNPVTVLALYRGNLMVFNAGGYQMWQIDPDPANMALLDAEPVGSTWTLACQSVANDLLFLAEVGVRNIGTSGASANTAAGSMLGRTSS
jgi:hypothetical protein